MADDVPRTAATRLIASYYSEALPLLSFLKLLVHGVQIVESGDELAYQSLIEGSWVGMEQGAEKRVFDFQQPSESQADVGFK